MWNKHELLILSDYDCGYCFSANYNGVRLNEDETNALYRIYDRDIHELKLYAFSKYHCDLIVCCDGSIALYPYEDNKD